MPDEDDEVPMPPDDFGQEYVESEFHRDVKDVFEKDDD
jgi:hypothetical protein